MVYHAVCFDLYIPGKSILALDSLNAYATVHYATVRNGLLVPILWFLDSEGSEDTCRPVS